jgi:outer membrane receptor protein involved in Fe transport
MRGFLPRRTKRTVLFALLLCGPSLASGLSGACAQTIAPGTVHGTVTTTDGLPVNDAYVTFAGAGSVMGVKSGEHGEFHLDSLAPGTYAVSVIANGYRDLRGRTIDVRPGTDAAVTFALDRSTSSLVTIGSVRANGSEALSSSSAAISIINAQTYAAQGYTQVSDVLQNDVSATLVHALGGSNTSLPTSVALRGPDPTETLVAIDGHQINNGNTGDFDLSLLDPSDYGNIELIKGISPSALVGPNTIDGAINIRSLEPTALPFAQARFGAGSYGSYLETLQATGTAGRLGYALSAHDTSTDGQVNQTVLDAASGTVQTVGSAVNGQTLLGLLRYSLGGNGSFATFTLHDQSLYRDLSAGLSSIPPPAGSADEGDDALRRRASDDAGTAPSYTVVDSLAGTSMLAHNASYGLDLGLPLFAPDAEGIRRANLLVRGFSSIVDQSVFGPGADSSPYLYNSRDLVNEGSVSFDYQLPRGSITLAYDLRNEQLLTDFAPGVVNDESITRAPVGVLRPQDASQQSSGITTLPLDQTERSVLLRFVADPTAQLHLTLAAYYSDYSLFGTNLDPRFGLAYTPDASSVVRFSVGSTYQAPQLPELYVPPVLPPAVGGYVNVGNPNLKPDYATEYGLGFERVLLTGAHRTTATLDWYHVNLRQPSSTYLPAPVANCESGPGTPACPLSYPVNAGDGVYQGFELSVSSRLAPNVSAQAAYGVHSAYLTSIPPYIQDGTLVAGEQTLGLPLHKATFSIAATPRTGFTYGLSLIYEGQYNELDQPPYATLAANLGYRWRKLEVSLAGTNLTNVYAQQFTHQGAGVPYAGVAGPIPTDSYALPATAFTLMFSYHN